MHQDPLLPGPDAISYNSAIHACGTGLGGTVGFFLQVVRFHVRFHVMKSKHPTLPSDSVLFWKRPLVKVASYRSSLHDWDSWHSWWVRTSLGRSSGKEHAWRMFQEMQKDWDDLVKNMTGWWFGTFCIFPYIGNNHPNWLIFFRGVDTTNQMNFHEFHGQLWRFYGGGWFHHGNHGNHGSHGNQPAANPGAISWRGNLQHSRLTKTGHGSDRGRARSETLLVRTTANDFTWNAVGYGSL